MMKKIIRVLLALSFIPFAAFAEDEGLYPAPPPADAAWIRNLDSSSVKVGNVTVSGNAYQMLAQGEYRVEGERLSIRAGYHYSLLRGLNGKPEVLTDPELENRSRSLLVFYNLSQQPALELTTADGRQSIISGVMQREMASRMVQPMAVVLAVKDGDNSVKLAPIVLKAGSVYSVIATSNGAMIGAGISENITAQSR